MNTIKHFIYTLAVSLALSSTVVSQEKLIETTLEQRLQHLVDRLETKRVEHHIPGMSLAVVLDDSTVLVHSFGNANIEDQIAVTTDTLFPIGSVTKSFTSTAVALLVDDGTMDWDAPITEYLPEFILPIDRGEGESDDSAVLVRDLLSHQTGFTRMHFLAINNSLSPQQTLRRAILAEPWETFRSEFLYNNVQYLATGYAAGKVYGSDWNTLVEERLLSPIGMNHTYTSWHRAPSDMTVVDGYEWDENEEVYDSYSLRTIDNIAPAGAIVSTASDMARWIRFHLGHGVIDDKQVLSPEQHAEMWKTQYELASGIGYGFGWLLHEQEGAYVVEHGGNVRGGCAQVAMYPDENLGFVLLMNVSASILQQESIAIVRESMLGDISDSDSSTDLTPYLGDYIGNFASFQNDTFQVSGNNGILAVDVPGQRLYELKPPDEDGKWYFALTDQVAISFDRNDDDIVVGMRFHQGGMTFELPREGVVIEPDIPLVELDRFLGEYQNDEEEMKPTVVIKNNRLAVDVPDQMVFEMYPPNDEGFWIFRVTDKLKLRFIEDESKLVTGFEFFEDDSTITFERVADSTKEVLPTVDTILATYHLADREISLTALGCIKLTGKTQMKQSGIDGVVTILGDSTGRLRLETDCGKFGWFRFGVVGNEGLMDIAFVVPAELDEDQMKHIRNASPLAWVGNWQDRFSSITLLKTDEIHDREVWIMKLENEDDPSRIVSIDKESGDIVRVESKQPLPEMGGSLPYTLTYIDFKVIEGVRIPMTIKERNDMTGLSVSHFNSIDTGIDASDEQFRIVPRERPEPWIAGIGIK